MLVCDPWVTKWRVQNKSNEESEQQNNSSNIYTIDSSVPQSFVHEVFSKILSRHSKIRLTKLDLLGILDMQNLHITI